MEPLKFEIGATAQPKSAEGGYHFWMQEIESSGDLRLHFKDEDGLIWIYKDKEWKKVED